MALSSIVVCIFVFEVTKHVMNHDHWGLMSWLNGVGYVNYLLHSVCFKAISMLSHTFKSFLIISNQVYVRLPLFLLVVIWTPSFLFVVYSVFLYTCLTFSKRFLLFYPQSVLPVGYLKYLHSNLFYCLLLFILTKLP